MSNPLFDALQAGLALREDAFLEVPGGLRLTPAEFLDQVARYAAVLQSQGVQPGDRVVVQIPKCAAALVLYMACLRSGAIFVPLNTGYTAAEVDYFLHDAEPRLMVFEPARESDLAELLHRCGVQALSLDANGQGSLPGSAAAQGVQVVPVVHRVPEDLAAILYTSGTTGRSKGAMLSHHNLLSNARALVQVWHFDANDVLLHALPVFHTHGLFVACHTLMLCGGKLLFHPGFDLDRVLYDLPRATTLMGVPTFYTRLLAEPRFTAELAAHMRLFISGSAPLLAETHRQFEARTGQRILERYGMTETGMNTSNPYAGERMAGTVGLPLPGVSLEVRDPHTDRRLPPGEVGMLQVRGSNVFRGYWRNPEKTREELKDDGFFITGDLGSIDARGYVTIVGRGKDLIITGGYNVYPREIESVLDALPGVQESAVVGAVHADLGEAVMAFVVTTPDAQGQAMDEAGVLQAVSGQLARFKQPRRIFIEPELPRNSMGKVQKNQLRERVPELSEASASITAARMELEE